MQQCLRQALCTFKFGRNCPSRGPAPIVEGAARPLEIPRNSQVRGIERCEMPQHSPLCGKVEAGGWADTERQAKSDVYIYTQVKHEQGKTHMQRIHIHIRKTIDDMFGAHGRVVRGTVQTARIQWLHVIPKCKTHDFHPSNLKFHAILKYGASSNARCHTTLHVDLQGGWAGQANVSAACKTLTICAALPLPSWPKIVGRPRCPTIGVQGHDQFLICVCPTASIWHKIATIGHIFLTSVGCTNGPSTSDAPHPHSKIERNVWPRPAPGLMGTAFLLVPAKRPPAHHSAFETYSASPARFCRKPSRSSTASSAAARSRARREARSDASLFCAGFSSWSER
mmetsp:Transcript_7300/g.26510  ORF Transcript_7300/g.26510 Transcript_7300/m.26510 type:complete len:339 (+) Transcript_7300:988-2004(+)